MTLFKKKHRNLQPWLDYFKMLGIYERSGYLEVQSEKGEAYITQPAFLALCCTSGQESLYDAEDILRALGSASRVVRRIRTYAGWKSQQGEGYIQESFALHIVKPEEPHDLLATVLLSYRRTWRSLWLKREHTEVITYDDDGKVL